MGARYMTTLPNGTTVLVTKPDGQGLAFAGSGSVWRLGTVSEIALSRATDKHPGANGERRVENR